jgi:hypothetical protein
MVRGQDSDSDCFFTATTFTAIDCHQLPLFDIENPVLDRDPLVMTLFTEGFSFVSFAELFALER